jgi:hypothetical protein
VIRFVAAFAAVCGLVAAGCTNTGDDPFPTNDAASVPDAIPLGPNYVSIEANIFRMRCTNVCHSGGPKNAAAGMDMNADAYAVLVGVPAAGEDCAPSGLMRIAPGDPEMSLLYLKVRAKREATAAPCGDPMPQGERPPITEAELEAIEGWILAGAPR